MSIDAADPSAFAEKPRLAAEPLIQRIWPLAVVLLGLSLSAAWTFVLGYGLVKLVEHVV